MTDEEPDMNYPDMGKVEYEIAIEAVAKMYNDFRKAGLPIEDAAAIIAAVMTKEKS